MHDTVIITEEILSKFRIMWIEDYRTGTVTIITRGLVKGIFEAFEKNMHFASYF